MFIEIVIFVITAILTYYIYVNKKIQYHFEKNGVRYVRGAPIFGNVFLSTLLKRSIVEDIDVVYKAFPEDRLVNKAKIFLRSNLLSKTTRLNGRSV